jgi:hypothetical protein
VRSTFEKHFCGVTEENSLVIFFFLKKKKYFVFSKKQNLNMFILRKHMFIFPGVEPDLLFIKNEQQKKINSF